MECGWPWAAVTTAALLLKMQGLFQQVLNGPTYQHESVCIQQVFDVDDDGDVDLRDWAGYHNCMSDNVEPEDG